MAKHTHKDVEFAIDKPKGYATPPNEFIYKTFAEAAAQAISLASSHGEEVNIDVLAWSEAGARWWGGDYAVEQYREDPEASIFERIVVRAENVGRIA